MMGHELPGEPGADKVRREFQEGYAATVAAVAAERDTLRAQNAKLLEALKGTALWILRADGTLCWCAKHDMEPDDEHLPACKAARAVIEEAQ